MNVLTITGRLTKKPEIEKTITGKNVCNVPIAVRKSADEAMFIYARFWEDTAKFVEKYFDKGQMIAISGELVIDSYFDKNDQKKQLVYINANKVDFCGEKRKD